MTTKKRKLSGWGNAPALEREEFTPHSVQELVLFLQNAPNCIARGSGRSYGDAALSGTVVSTLHLTETVDFDPQRGIFHCGAGVTIGQILAKTVPYGWMVPVLPGTQHITVGGAIAANIHGKNQEGAQQFSDILIDFWLMDAKGQHHYCSRTQHPDLFWNTCGGMGQTGIITEARFWLQSLPTIWMEQQTVATHSVQDLLDTLGRDNEAPYSAAWLDARTLEGRVFFAKFHAHRIDHDYQPATVWNIPFKMPVSLLNNWSMPWYNRWYAHKHPAGKKVLPFHAFFFPLDGLGRWNRLYGPNGLLQYHACFPTDAAGPALEQILAKAQQHGQMPFLTVVKKHRAPLPELPFSFLQKGFSIAMDFPNNAPSRALFQQLDQITLYYDGKIYAAKDACATPEAVAWHAFPATHFESDMKRRYAPPQN